MINNLFEEMNICAGFGPVDMATAANNGDWISLKNYEGIAIVLFKAAGTAGDDPVFTLRQASDVAGTGAKALNFTTIYEKVGTLTSIGTFTKVTQAAANTYTNTVSAEAAAIMGVHIRASELDTQNGFDCVQFQVPDIGANAQLGAGFYILLNPRYAQPLSAIVD